MGLTDDPDLGFKPGDRIRVTRPGRYGIGYGPDVREGAVHRVSGHTHLKMQGQCIHDYEADGWSITRITSKGGS